MVRKSRTIPEQGELVVGKITKVNPFSVQVQLDDYPNIDASVHISEVARSWIKDIRSFVKEGQHVVALVVRVEGGNNHVDISLKRVSRNEADAKLKAIKSEQRAEKMLEQAAKDMGSDLNRAYKEVGFKMQEEFGSLFEAFKVSMEQQGRELLLKKGIPQKWIDVISVVAEKAMEAKEMELKARLELTSYAPNGLQVVKGYLAEIEKKGIDVKYVSAPKYALTMKTKDAKKGERIIKETAEAIVKKIEQSGGKGAFTMVK